MSTPPPTRWEQRNWSRVGITRFPAEPGTFHKRFVDARGSRLEALFREELASLARLDRLRPQMTALDPILPIANYPAELEIVFPLRDFERLDDHADLRRALHRDLSDRLRAVRRDLAALSIPDDPLRLRPSRCAAGPVVVGWKGLDVKNLGVTGPDNDRLLLFDIGPMYRSHECEPIARLVASALVSHWGTNIPRTVRGVPEWAREVLDGLLPHTCRLEVHHRLDRLLAVRLDEPQPGSLAKRLAGPAATRLLSRRYWADARRWVDTYIGDHKEPA